MVGGRRRHTSAGKNTAMEENASLKDGVDDDAVIDVDDDSSLQQEIARLRGRWELASVLNFLSVFEPVIGTDLKLTAEEIEAGLVEPNSSLAQLHIKLLKGIPPVSKTLNGSDAWVTALCKKISMWWPWQDDSVSYINDALKSGTEISSFRKDKIGEDGNAACYWCDGGPVIGHRLYKEVKKTDQKTKWKGKASYSLTAVSSEWQTLATNLEEFQKAVDELSSSRVVGRIAVGRTVETNFLPLVEKFQKKKERALKQKQRQERLLNDFTSYGTGITRSCRSRRPISYTFDDYDRAIDEAIEVTKKSKTTKEQRNEKKHFKQEKCDGDSDRCKESHAENGVSEMFTDSKDKDTIEADSLDSETESDSIQQDVDGDKDDDYGSKSDNDYGNESGKSDEENANPGERNCSKKPFGTRWSMRLAGVMNHPVPETRNLATKNRLRQRPTRNSALDSIVIDSEDENLSQNTNSETGHEHSSPLDTSEEFSDG
ncbi:hypothetical protein RCOM_0803470 [Ricinus communis]|uniref:DDT domain-containing protein DDR4 n=1 Tax=Ricinus communis TaxID=3988 RepID=B9RS74_RICCO|nr:hypothetical protein RCOM_0803470 [Ricinus communis]